MLSTKTAGWGLVALVAGCVTGFAYWRPLADFAYPRLAEVFRLEERVFAGPEYRGQAAGHRRAYGAGGRYELVFVGDSHVQYLGPEKMAGKCSWANFGIAGDTTEGVLRRLGGDIPKIGAGRVWILVGYNDLKYRPPEAVVANLARVVLSAAERFDVPVSRVFVQSLLPVSERRRSVNGALRAINAQLPALCAALGCRYVDVHADFYDPETEGIQAGLTRDGLHLNVKGYEVLSRTMKDNFVESTEEKVRCLSHDS